VNAENTLIQIISTLAILFPLAFNVRMFKTAGIIFRLFFVFLLLGFCNDLLGWYHYYINYVLNLKNTTLSNVRLFASIAYSLVEAVFFFWLVSEYPYFKRMKGIRIAIFMLIGAGGAYLLLWQDLVVGGDVSHSSLFDATYQVIISFATGFILLDYAEKELDMIRFPLFWIFAGIFFYCFSTFFIFAIKLIVAESIANQIWFVHNIVNIFTYVFFCLGFGEYFSIGRSRAS
jgi:hypothetical protein